jgi:hypothetical protein
MYNLNLGFDNTELYKGCDVQVSESGKFRLVSPLDSTNVIIAANLVEMIKTIPKSVRNKLIVTGGVPPSIIMTAMRVFGPFFANVVHFDGISEKNYDIPNGPPPSEDGEPE